MTKSPRRQIVESLEWLQEKNLSSTADDIACLTTFWLSSIQAELDVMIKENVLINECNQYEFAKGVDINELKKSK